MGQFQLLYQLIDLEFSVLDAIKIFFNFPEALSRVHKIHFIILAAIFFN